MPTVKIIGYGTGHEKVELTELLRDALQLGMEESRKMTDAIMSGNVISLKFEDEEFANGLAQELADVGARVQVVED
ncbi:MAG: hypothetical protein R2747_02105 [Pyrinomonadaceae bacterium]